jgi:hypothetical protein
MEPEENEEVVEEVLAGTQSLRRVARDEVAKSLAADLIRGIDPQALVDAGGQFRTSPVSQQTDGFYAAVLEKRSLTDSCFEPGGARPVTPLAISPFMFSISPLGSSSGVHA